MKAPRWPVLCLLLAALAGPATAHEIRPGYLEIAETASGLYRVTLTEPQQGGTAPALGVVLPDGCRDAAPAVLSVGAAVARSIRQVDCGGTGPGGQVVRVDGLQARPRDVLVRVVLLDRPVRTWMLRSGAGSFHIRGDPTGTQVFRTYVQLGLEHILSGLDHLLFVLCLVLLVQGGWRVIQTITAFTVAHSVTLGLAALGLVRVPQPPVEAVIALSILLLASELAGQQAGRPGLTRRFPWSVALGCGLLHGLGFAGALTDVGLPEGDVYLALFGFNLGVELGQLLFVGLLLALMGLLRRLPVVGPAWIRGVPAYGIGSLAAFWTLQRIAAF